MHKLASGQTKCLEPSLLLGALISLSPWAAVLHCLGCSVLKLLTEHCTLGKLKRTKSY